MPKGSPTDRIETFKKRNKENSKCAVCGGYVTTVLMQFNSFVCSRCSGLLREAGFSVKGITMTNWKEGEADKICSGGNAREREELCGGWDGKELAVDPDSDEASLRAFIQAKYVEKRWSGAVRGDGGGGGIGGGGSSGEIKEQAKRFAAMFPELSEASARELIERHGHLDAAVDAYLSGQVEAPTQKKRSSSSKKDRKHSRRESGRNEAEPSSPYGDYAGQMSGTESPRGPAGMAGMMAGAGGPPSPYGSGQFGHNNNRPASPYRSGQFGGQPQQQGGWGGPGDGAPPGSQYGMAGQQYPGGPGGGGMGGGQGGWQQQGPPQQMTGQQMPGTSWGPRGPPQQSGMGGGGLGASNPFGGGAFSGGGAGGKFGGGGKGGQQGWGQQRPPMQSMNQSPQEMQRLQDLQQKQRQLQEQLRTMQQRPPGAPGGYDGGMQGGGGGGWGRGGGGGMPQQPYTPPTMQSGGMGGGGGGLGKGKGPGMFPTGAGGGVPPGMGPGMRPPVNAFGANNPFG